MLNKVQTMSLVGCKNTKNVFFFYYNRCYQQYQKFSSLVANFYKEFILQRHQFQYHNDFAPLQISYWYQLNSHFKCYV